MHTRPHVPGITALLATARKQARVRGAVSRGQKLAQAGIRVNARRQSAADEALCSSRPRRTAAYLARMHQGSNSSSYLILYDDLVVCHRSKSVAMCPLWGRSLNFSMVPFAKASRAAGRPPAAQREAGSDVVVSPSVAAAIPQGQNLERRSQHNALRPLRRDYSTRRCLKLSARQTLHVQQRFPPHGPEITCLAMTSQQVHPLRTSSHSLRQRLVFDAVCGRHDDALGKSQVPQLRVPALRRAGCISAPRGSTICCGQGKGSPASRLRRRLTD